MNKEKDTAIVDRLLKKVLDGIELCETELYTLADIDSKEGKHAILEGAARITQQFVPGKFDTCSIVNARSGKCSEDCKWCAQSGHYSTGCDTYDLVDREEAMHIARYNAERGVGRYSLVASGRAVKGKALDHMCAILKEVQEKDRINTCASMGLLNEEELQQLWNAGVRRYHCNLETAPSHFSKLCTTHTTEDKIATINAARRIGFEVCSGGIIGMGETRRQRMELAITLRRVEPASIPINILCRIPGTPLENAEVLSDEEIVLTIALFRFAHPSVTLRFAGGRARLSREVQLQALRTGINGAIVGDLLTTIGSTIDEDKNLVESAGYSF